MPLRPIDAIFVNPKQRLYVVYYRGELWQLPRMKIDDRSWQNRRPYTDDSSSLYLSIHQAISDPVLAQKLRTLDLPAAVRGSTLSRFEAWWEAHGFKWLKDKLMIGQSPLAAHQTADYKKTISSPPIPSLDHQPPTSNDNDTHADNKANKPVVAASIQDDIFAEMLTELTNEVLDQKL